jgi:hypothetical protein
MALGWNEIKERAVKFSKEWEDTYNEEADAKPFLVEFFNVFGINSRKVSTFEHRVSKLGDLKGYIDLFWKGTIVIEMKSRGKNLDKAYQQAKDYLHGLKQHELPKYILVSDFETFRLTDLEENEVTEFKLADLVNHIHLFGFIAGYQKRTYKEEDAVNAQAAERMGNLHDALKESGYTGHELEKYLVRLLFCLFAEDTTIFEKRSFQEYLENYTKEDGSDLGMHLAQLFQVLNTPCEKRQSTLDEVLVAFPYVNGKLFEEMLHMAAFNSKMHKTLLECCYLDWSKISPAIFGSMFQSVMNPAQRRNLGAHYTSEKNILKLIKPLFLDKLWKEFEAVKGNTNKLREFHRKIGSLRFLDPACGCGNFLVITYRELRLLELEVLKELQKGQRVIDLESLMQCNVDKFYGIEYEEFPAQIAQVALWLIDHQMNMLISLEFGEYVVRLPLTKSAYIVHGNALRVEWDSLLNSEKTVSIHAKEANVIKVGEPALEYGKVNVFAEKVNILDRPPVEEQPDIKFDYIIGNPPFIGSKLMSQEQRNDVSEIFNSIDGSRLLDYVSAWYAKAAKYLHDYSCSDSNSSINDTQVAFVSTNSIVQGEQVGLLWQYIKSRYGIKINFAHTTFRWTNEARGIAAVYCVIIGFSKYDRPDKKLFIYDDVKGDPHEVLVSQINSYLVGTKDVYLRHRQHPLSNVPEMSFGNMPLDGGNLLLTPAEKNELLKIEPLANKYLKRVIGSKEFIHNIERWCLWLLNADPSDLIRSKFILDRVEKVKQFRLSSIAPSTQKFGNTPSLFRDTKVYDTYIVIPGVSSENRRYIPIGFQTNEVIPTNLVHIIPNGTLYHLGILTSEIHMAWVKYTCGRLESRFRYSKDIVYNNFPWPEKPTEKQKASVEKAAQKVLDVRAEFPNSSLADLYDPLTMPPALVKAHAELDKIVDLAYRSQPFTSDAKRIEYLFDLYDKYTAGLFVKEKKKSKISN